MVFDKVLLLAKEDGFDVKIGNPYLDGVSIAATVATKSSRLRTMLSIERPFR